MQDVLEVDLVKGFGKDFLGPNTALLVFKRTAIGPKSRLVFATPFKGVHPISIRDMFEHPAIERFPAIPCKWSITTDKFVFNVMMSSRTSYTVTMIQDYHNNRFEIESHVDDKIICASFSDRVGVFIEEMRTLFDKVDDKSTVNSKTSKRQAMLNKREASVQAAIDKHKTDLADFKLKLQCGLLTPDDDDTKYLAKMLGIEAMDMLKMYRRK